LLFCSADVFIVISNMLLILFLIGAVFEVLLIYIPYAWKYRQFFSVIAAALISFWMGMLIISEPHVSSLALMIVSFYRLFNLFRIGENRIAEPYLFRTAGRCSLTLIAVQSVAYSVVSSSITLSSNGVLVLLATLQLIAGICILAITSRNIFKTQHHTTQHFFSDKELPSVTVAIPARNETADLASCLQTVLANNYPKLEILVLDDCSQDSTPDIIKDFAQDGVRFLEGEAPTSRWLAKNYAYHQLSEAASGEFILFCGVDVRLGPDAIRSLVTTLLNKNRLMMSVMPLRFGGDVRTAFIQPMRYWWELALPRRFFNRPPVLSSCWLIRRKALKKLGGFSAVSRTIIPETFFARELVKSDSYAFIRADEQLDVRTVKSVQAQLQTAIRTRYPQVKRQPENVLLLSFLEALLLLGPFIIALASLWRGFDAAAWLACLAGLMFIFTHYQIMAVSNPANNAVALINFPIVVITEIIMLHLSMYRYEFSMVEWKGRNVCIPVMRVIPKLPPV
jgi:chlorobactene glucosyltransferase